jgi:phosphoribulokinase
MSSTERKRPVVIGIVGDSGSGKTTFAQGLARILGLERTVNICADDYHRYARSERPKIGITPHDPACNYIDILEQHIALLRDGQPILKPIYNHNGGILEAPEYIAPKDFIVVEGLLAFFTPRLREAFDVKFYMEPEEQLRVRWKFQRDVAGGYTVEQVMATLDRLKRDTTTHIVPQRAYADMVVSFYPPDSRPEETGAGLNVRHILRPTLPYLDLSPLLEAGADKGFELELARDVDGRPVDALHIFGGIDEARCEAMEAYLAGELALPRTNREGIGAFTNGQNAVVRSHTLALSQLVVTHYLLNAALGDHVVGGE